MGKREDRHWWQRLWSGIVGNGRHQDDDKADTAVPDNLPLFVPEVKIERGQNDVPRASIALSDDESGVDAVALRQQMMNHLKMAALTRVATAVAVDIDAMPGGKGRKVMGLVQACGENGRLADLLQACQAEHPDVEWQPEWSV